MWKRLRYFSQNFYFIVAVLFIGFVLFVDSNDLVTQIALERENNFLREERRSYQQKIEQIRQQRAQLEYDTAMWERIARERYLLRRPSEDVYVIEQSK